MALVTPLSSDPAPKVDLEKVKRIYLLGIGGTGMGSFAGLLKSAGYRVAGSDEALYPPMSDMLERWGIHALRGYDAAHLNSVTLDNVVIDGITAGNVEASYTSVTLGPGNVNFTPSGTDVTVTNDISGSSTPNPCTNKWVTF